MPLLFSAFSISFLFLEGMTRPFRDDTGIIRLDTFLKSFVFLFFIPENSAKSIIGKYAHDYL
jgi:hypothetical protein